MSTPRFDAVGVVASDVAASIAFYRRVGVPFPDDVPIESHVECALGTGMRMMIDSAESIVGMFPDYVGEVGNRVAFAAQLGSAAEVDALYAELDADGHGKLPPWDAEWGMRYCSVQDPDGVQVDLYAWLPGAPGAPAGD